MNIKEMKKIDHYVGIPVCLFFDLLKKIFFFLPSRRFGTPRKILIMKFFGMGSIVLSSPMLRALKRKHPQAKIAFLTFSKNRSIVERLGLADHVYILRTDSLFRFCIDVLKTVLAMRREHYDVTIDMEFFAKFSTIMTHLSGSPVRIGYFLRQIWRGDLLTHQVYYNHFKHITEIFAALVAPLDVPVDDHSLERPAVSPVEDVKAAELLAQYGIRSDELIIVFNVNASELSMERRWPTQNFRILAEALLSKLQVKILFIGGDGDAPYVNSITDGLRRFNGRAINICGKTGLGELIALISRCGLFVSNDSGPLHLAVACDIPTVSFFGPETPTLYGPKNNDALVFYDGVYCSPCLNVYNAKTSPCAGKNICMQGITPERVLAAMHDRFHDLWEKYPISGGTGTQ